MRQLFVIALALAGCADGPGAPPLDSCLTPSAGSADALEVGAASSADLAGGTPTQFAPLHDGDGMALIRGAQGANMLGFILRVSGSSAPSCLGQQTIVTDTAGARITTSTPPLATYAQPDGTRLTHPLWLPADYPATFVVDVTAANQSLQLHLHLLLTK